MTGIEPAKKLQYESSPLANTRNIGVIEARRGNRTHENLPYKGSHLANTAHTSSCITSYATRNIFFPTCDLLFGFL